MLLCVTNTLILSSRRYPRYWRAVFGVNDIFNPEDTEQISEIKQIMSHRNFDSTTMDNDLALLELANPVKYTDYIIPVCLATWVLQVDPSAPCFITGWGKTSTRGNPVYSFIKLYIAIIWPQTGFCIIIMFLHKL